jgi:hypothetical protein
MQSNVLFFALSLLFVFLTSFISIRPTNNVTVNSYSPNYCPPDSTIDTSSTFYEFGDTIAVNLDGGDTIFIINDNIDTAMANGRIIGTGDIIVALTNHQNELPDEMYGVTLQIFLCLGMLQILIM